MPSLDRRELASIFAGGAVGAVLRVWLVQTFTGSTSGWPWVIFAINITGTLERARLLTGEVGPVQLPEQLGEATKLTVYVGREDRALRTPPFVAVCDLLHRRGIAGATALLGVDGTRGGRRARARSSSGHPRCRRRTPPRAPRDPSRSSTSSPASMALSPARWSQR